MFSGKRYQNVPPRIQARNPSVGRRLATLATRLARRCRRRRVYKMTSRCRPQYWKRGMKQGV
jgi:hypothetical protein